MTPIKSLLRYLSITVPLWVVCGVATTAAIQPSDDCQASLPTVANANVNVYSPVVVQYTCRLGFIPVGLGSAVCQAGKWLWSDKEPFKCHLWAPINVPNSSRHCVNGSTVRYTCDLGYTQQGTGILHLHPKPSPAMTHYWDDGVEFKCTPIQCGATPTVLHGMEVGPNTPNDYNTARTIKCDDGYSINGLGRKEATILCLADGMWAGSHVNCVKDLPAVPNATLQWISSMEGQYNCDKGYKNTSGSAGKVTIIQHQEYDLELSWSDGIELKCETVDCGDMLTVQFGDKKLKSGNGTEYKAVWTVTCSDGYSIHGDQTTTQIDAECQADGTWSNSDALCVKNPPTVANSQYVRINALEGQYTCDTGYTPNGSSGKVSRYNMYMVKYQWDDGIELVCTIVDCGQIPVVYYSQNWLYSRPDKYGREMASKFGTIWTLECDEGYRIAGRPGVYKIQRECKLDGKWTDHDAACEQDIPKTVTRATTTTTTTPPPYYAAPPTIADSSRLKVSDVEYQYTCDKGHTTTGSGKMTRRSDGNFYWADNTDFSCPLVGCGFLPGEENSGTPASNLHGTWEYVKPIRHPRGDWAYGSKFRLWCDAGYHITQQPGVTDIWNECTETGFSNNRACVLQIV